jgi:NADPH2:quinone reductase
MRAIVVEQPGGLEALELRQVAEPEIGPHDVLIDIAYCGCNWADTQRRQGIYPHPVDYPDIIGREVSGTIAAIGDAVESLAVGDRVAASVWSGGYAERGAAKAAMVTALPDAVPLDVGAAFQVQGQTAYHMLHTVYRVKPGDTVLVHAAGGGVGLMVVQLAVHAGARVIGTVGTSGKEVKPLAYGASEIVNLNEGDFVAAALALTGGSGVDLAIDSLGAATLDRTFAAVRLLGHVINIGEAEGVPYQNIRERILPRSQTFTRFHLGHLAERPDLWRAGNAYLLAAITDGWLEVPIVDRFALADARAMHARLEGRGVAGKLLLDVRA